MDGLDRRAGQFELAAGLERDRAAAGHVDQADDVAALDDRLPAEQVLHAFEQRADAAPAVVGNRRVAVDVNANFSCSVPMRNSDFGLMPASNHATSSSRVSIGVMSTWSRAMRAFRRKGRDHTRGPRRRAMTARHRGRGLRAQRQDLVGTGIVIFSRRRRASLERSR